MKEITTFGSSGCSGEEESAIASVCVCASECAAARGTRRAAAACGKRPTASGRRQAARGVRQARRAMCVSQARELSTCVERVAKRTSFFSITEAFLVVSIVNSIAPALGD